MQGQHLSENLTKLQAFQAEIQTVFAKVGDWHEDPNTAKHLSSKIDFLAVRLKALKLPTT